MSERNRINTLALGGLVVASLAWSVPASADQIFNFGDFTNACSGGQLTCVGNTAATTTADGAVLRLTPSQGGQAGAAYSTTAVTLGSSATFSTTFQFRFTSPGGIDPADGIVFVISNTPSGLGTGGYGIGYAGSSQGHSLGIEFDTFDDDNIGYSNGPVADASSNHVAIDLGGALTNTASANPYGVANCTLANGYLGTGVDTYKRAGCMSNGDLWSVTIGYDGSKLSVTISDPAEGTVQNIISNFPVDPAALLGSPTAPANTAYVGFTSGTGAGWENHDIKDWSFNSDLGLVTPPVTPPAGVPEPMSMTLLGIGALGLVATRRRGGRTVPKAG